MKAQPLAKPEHSNLAKVVLAYIVCVLVWGTSWYAIRVCIQQPGYLSYQAAALRFTISAAVLLSIWAVIAHRTPLPTIKQVFWIALAATFSGLAYGFLYVSERAVSGGIAALQNELVLPTPLPQAPTLALFYLALFATLIAFGSFFYLLKHVRLSTVMTMSFITPTIALMMDAVFEKHLIFTAQTYIGIAIVLAGVATTVIRNMISHKTQLDAVP